MRVHFICVRHQNLFVVGHPIYRSGFWDVSEETARKLVGASIYLHESKGKPAWFGGTIVDFEVVDTDRQHPRRVVFRIRSLADHKGVVWEGVKHVRAWWSGIIEDSPSTESAHATHSSV